MGSIPGSVRSPGEGNSNLHLSILAWRMLWTEEPVGYCSWGCKELDMTEQLKQQQCILARVCRSWTPSVRVSHSVVSDSLLPPWTVVRQAPQSMEVSRQEYWSGLLFPSLGDLPDPRIEAVSLASASGFFTTSANHNIFN